MYSLKTDIKVSEAAIKKTTKCRKKFSCLSGGIAGICKVEKCIGKDLLFIECKENQYCNYRAYFGYSSLCTCPVRKELHSRYNI